MPRLLSLLMILAVVTTCLPSDWTRAQEPDQKCSEGKECQKCPVAKKTSSYLEFELPGIDFPGNSFPVQFHVAVEHGKTPGKQAADGGNIEIHCECQLKNSGVPFLSCLSEAGKLFTNVGLPPHAQSCTTSKTAATDGQCSTCPGDDNKTSCKTCQQASTCEESSCCPKTQTGVPFEGPNHDRLFTNIGYVKASSCELCQQGSQCQGCDDCKNCEGCPATCPKTVQATGSQVVPTHPHDVQLVGYAKTTRDENADPHRFEMREQMFELRLENERLKMEVKAAEQMLEVMEEVMEMREENAVLRTQLEFLEAHHDHAAKQTPSPHHAK